MSDAGNAGLIYAGEFELEMEDGAVTVVEVWEPEQPCSICGADYLARSKRGYPPLGPGFGAMSDMTLCAGHRRKAARP